MGQIVTTTLEPPVTQDMKRVPEIVELTDEESVSEHDTEVLVSEKKRIRSRFFKLSLFDGEDGQSRFARFNKAIEEESEKFKKTIQNVVWQLEKCPRTGKEHLQIFVACFTAKDETVVRKLFNLNHVDDPQFQFVDARDKENPPAKIRNYCKKKETRISGPWEYGTWKSNLPGKRNDIHDAVKVLKEEGKDALVEKYPEYMMRHPLGVEKLAELYADPEERKTIRPIRVYVFMGESNVGKSKLAQTLVRKQGMTYSILKRSALCGKKIWFDDYRGEKVLIIDEFEGWIPRTYLNDILRGDPMMCQQKHVKGGIPAKWEIVIITTNTEWYNWYPQQFENPIYKDSMKNRLHHKMKIELVEVTTDNKRRMKISEWKNDKYQVLPSFKLEEPEPYVEQEIEFVTE